MAEPSALRVPLKVNVWEPATAVRLTVWPLTVPVTVADPLQSIGGVAGDEIE
jgi:hypothetical protein